MQLTPANKVWKYTGTPLQLLHVKMDHTRFESLSSIMLDGWYDFHNTHLVTIIIVRNRELLQYLI